MGGIVIVGAGQAGAALVAKLRAEGYAGPLALVGDEPLPPYQRPPLSKKYLLGEMPLERLFLRPAAFYADHGIDLVLGRAVTLIDPGRRQVVLADGSVLAFDRLALTTGARPRRLPAAAGGALPGVHVLRRVEDVDRLAPEVRPGVRAVIVGGGYIGLEAAAVMAARGLEVTVVEAAPRLLARVACAETAAWFRALHEGHGVRIVTEAALARLEAGPDGRLAAALLADGRQIAAELAVVGIGISPDTRLAAGAGLALADGIACDAGGRTSDPAIWAAGDCASFPAGGGRMRLESVQNAIDMAETVACTMLGAGLAYAPVPWFWSDQFDVKLQIAGLGAGADCIVVRRDGAARSHWYFAGARLMAVDAMNDPRAYMAGKRLLEAGRSPDPAAVADPATSLRALVG
ncbi:MAG: FAD-dependent oxidoreductase [Rhodobacteraceae bacterium]|nr:FAD-dependent oxidoreductase [Paracoccaceae bacterium]